MLEANIIPRLYVKSQGEQTTKLALQLTRAPRKFLVRMTGGCGKMSAEDAAGLYELFNQAFVGYDGAMLYGGTRMLMRDDPQKVFPSITEIPTNIRAICPNMVLLGVVPRTQDLGLSEHGMIVANEPEQPYFTVVHPVQDLALVVQVGPDDPEVWDAEYRECLAVAQALRDYAGFSNLLVSYNGGTVTKREILAHVEREWPVMLVRGSGRVTDELAADASWLATHRCVHVVDKDPADMRRVLATLGAVPQQRLALVKESKTAS